MNIIVQKYGGSSLSTPAHIQRIAKRIKSRKHSDVHFAVIVSAMGDTTDHLIHLSKEISKQPPSREMDMLLSTGEQVSASLLAMALLEENIPSVSLNAYQCGIFTDGFYGKSKVSSISTERIKNEFEKGNIVIITGFQGINQENNLTTLGRGGSDTSAIAVSKALGAEICEIYTDVNGIYTADPRYVKKAKKLNQIEYDTMLELSRLGTGVMHVRSIELARKYHIPIFVASSFVEQPIGTYIKEGNPLEKVKLRGLSIDNQIAKISIIGVPDQPGIAHKLFFSLHSRHIPIDMIIQNVTHNGCNDITFTLPLSEHLEALQTIKNLKKDLLYKEIQSTTEVSKLSIVGTGVMGQGDIAEKFFRTLANLQVNVDMISTSDIKLSIILNKKQGISALEALHEAFYEDFDLL